MTADPTRVPFHPSAPLLLPLEVQGFDLQHPMFRKGRMVRDFYAVFVLQDARGHHRLAGETQTLQPGQLVVCPPGMLHDVQGWEQAQGHLILFDPAVFLPQLSLPVQDTLILLPYTLKTHSFALDPEALDRWTGWCKWVMQEVKGPGPATRDALLAQGQLMLVWLYRTVSPHLPAVSSHQGELLRRVFAFIQAHHQQPIALADVAVAVHRSRAHLTHVVSRCTGKSVGEWIIVMRLMEARKLLLSTSWKVDRIALQVGYRDTSHFIEQFRVRQGSTPQAWRRQMKGLAS